MGAPVQNPVTALMEAVQQLDQQAGISQLPLDPQPIWRALEHLPPTSSEGVLDLIRAGEIFFERGEFQQAIQFLQEGLTRARQHHLPNAQAMALVLLAEIDRGQGLYRDAFPRLHEALNLLPEVDDLYTQARILLLAGLNALALGELDLACQRFSEAHQVYHLIGRPDDLRLVLSHLGNLSTVMGDYQQAERWLRESLALAENSTDNTGIAQVFSNLGEVLRLQKRYAEARYSFEAALGLYESAGKPPEILMTENDLGHVAGAMQDFSRALAHYQRAFEIAEHLDLSAHMVDTLAGMVVMVMDLGHTTRALELAGYLLRHPSFILDIERYFRPILLPLLADTGLPFTAGVEDPPIPDVIRETMAFLEKSLEG